MVRAGDAIGAAAAVAGLMVTRLINYDEKNGIPALNVLYTSDEDQAWYFMQNRLNSQTLGIDMQWKPVLKGKPTSRSSLLQIAAGDWVLIYDVLPTPWYGTAAQPLSDRMCDFLQEKGRTFYGMILPVDAARIAFELDCVISSGVDLRKNPWPGANTTGGLLHLGNSVLNMTVREDRKVAISNWEWRPLTGQQLRYMAEKTYTSWAIADHFLKTTGRPSEESIVMPPEIYGAGGRLRKAGLVMRDTKYDWTRAKAEWLLEALSRKEESPAAEEAAFVAAEVMKSREEQTWTRDSRKAKYVKPSNDASTADESEDTASPSGNKERARGANKEKRRRKKANTRTQVVDVLVVDGDAEATLQAVVERRRAARKARKSNEKTTTAAATIKPGEKALAASTPDALVAGKKARRPRRRPSKVVQQVGEDDDSEEFSPVVVERPSKEKRTARRRSRQSRKASAAARELAEDAAKGKQQGSPSQEVVREVSEKGNAGKARKRSARRKSKRRQAISFA